MDIEGIVVRATARYATRSLLFAAVAVALTLVSVVAFWLDGGRILRVEFLTLFGAAASVFCQLLDYLTVTAGPSTRRR